MKYYGGIMGIMQYVLPIGTFAVAIKLASDEGEELTAKLIQYGIAIISLSVVFSVFQISSGELQSSKEHHKNEIEREIYETLKQTGGRKVILSPGCVIRYPLDEDMLSFVRRAKEEIEKKMGL